MFCQASFSKFLVENIYTPGYNEELMNEETHTGTCAKKGETMTFYHISTKSLF